jgi:RNA polymerase sigma factor (sigma-70 family)
LASGLEFRPSSRLSATGGCDRKRAGTRAKWRRESLAGAETCKTEPGEEGAEPTASGLEAAFLANRGGLLRFLKACGAREEAEDLLHELWIGLRAAGQRPVSEPIAYLYGMANKLVLGRRRSDQRRRRREEEWSDAEAAGPGSTIGSGERVLIGQQQIRAVEKMLAGLGPKTEAIFRRFRVDGMVQSEIASDLGISLSAVEKHLQKAYRALIAIREQIDAE